jgi:hypothetical protein
MQTPLKAPLPDSLKVGLRSGMMQACMREYACSMREETQ